jgi:hypothetical protein
MNPIPSPVFARPRPSLARSTQSPTTTKETAFLSLRSGQALALAMTKRVISGGAQLSEKSAWHQAQIRCSLSEALA